MAVEPLFPNQRPMNYRRHLFLKELGARALGLEAVALAWKGYRLEREAGTALATTFPFRAKLVAAGYSELELLDGATIEELARYAGLGQLDAKVVIAATKAAVTALEDA